jgi:hypothetical protein
MSNVRALAFVCFMASMAALSSVNTQAKSVFHCSEQETCSDVESCGGACSCTCDNYNAWPIGCGGGPYHGDGFCSVPYSAE